MWGIFVVDMSVGTGVCAGNLVGSLGRSFISSRVIARTHGTLLSARGNSSPVCDGRPSGLTYCALPCGFGKRMSLGSGEFFIYSSSGVGGRVNVLSLGAYRCAGLMGDRYLGFGGGCVMANVIGRSVRNGRVIVFGSKCGPPEVLGLSRVPCACAAGGSSYGAGMCDAGLSYSTLLLSPRVGVPYVSLRGGDGNAVPSKMCRMNVTCSVRNVGFDSVCDLAAPLVVGGGDNSDSVAMLLSGMSRGFRRFRLCLMNAMRNVAAGGVINACGVDAGGVAVSS